MRRTRRDKCGYTFAETFLGACILVPVALFILDLSVVIIANSINDSAVKNATRAAANQPSGQKAVQAATQSLASIRSTTIIKSIALEEVTYVPDQKVTCRTKMIVRLPVPLPGQSNLTFVARAVEPVVGTENKN